MKKFFALLISAVFLLEAPCISVYAADAPESDSAGYIVKIKDDESGTASLSAADFREAVHGLLTVGTQDELDALTAAGYVAYAEPNYSVHLAGAANDPKYGSQWNLLTTGMEEAWDAGLTGEGATIAVIDSGIYAGHEDLSGANILEGVNLLDNSDDVTDTLGHGTIVSGIIAAVDNNGIGIAGIADKTAIVPMKCFLSEDEASVMDIVRGIYYAVDDYGCDVICLSLGTESDSLSLHAAVNYAADNGVIVVAAAGNEGGTQYFYPASYESVIGVASYGKDGLVSSFSEKNDGVFISAPGSEIISTYIGRPNAYVKADGTSFSAPHVAAMAAIAKSVLPDMTVSKFKSLLIETSDDAGETGYDTSYGYGKINIGKFSAALLRLKAAGADRFADISGHWAENSISYCLANGYFDGVTDTAFQPEGGMTRGMLVTVLMRYDNGATGGVYQGTGFADVSDSSAWYYDAVYWAAANGIVDGYDDGGFHPNDAITREQIAAILYRYAGLPATENAGALSAFSDAGAISAYAVDALSWCLETGILNGTTETLLSPNGGATRAQVATMVNRFAERA